ncbi:MAG TPA: FAD-dependent monooxygenase [Pseudonocardia sp.]|uniref:FAD-dependent monooxygenase n=1 Tax=Pseudonocardia sp. TaxID=60912 RepID=UPI002C6512E3|nr:FAD-dependent monooxygenase [Pseudonocardia sp.]HTF51780.1 FAD-dependent monooxygenase [Pseudonocardia sp.]
MGPGPVRVAVVGGGPGGLFLATLVRRADPSTEVTVFERNRAGDTFGFGVVFSDRTLAGIHAADPVLREALERHGRHWDEIEVRLKGERLRCAGNGMAAIARRTLLRLLADRAEEAGAEVRYATEVRLADLDGYDLVVAADGTGSTVRQELRGLGVELGESVETASAKFIWFGTDYLFDGLTFVHQRGPHGVFAVHGYPISDEVSTFIVETDEASWRAAGLDRFDDGQPPGPSDLVSQTYLENLFAGQIDGRRLLGNNSRWGNFRTRRTSRWSTCTPRPVALLGDAVHTAHFSVGSGTKMAMEDAVALAAALTEHPGDLAGALAGYEAAAQPSVRAIQGSAGPSLSWWEHFGRYHDAFEPWQFGYHFLSRSITDARLARRDRKFVAEAHRGWLRRHGAEPLHSELELAGVTLKGRVLTVTELLATEPDSGVELPLFAELPPGVAGERWGARVRAPDQEGSLAAALDQLAALVAAGPALVAVHGGTPLNRTLLCEQARLRHGVPALLVDDELDRDRAVTAVLSGRADLVGLSEPEEDIRGHHDQ